MRRAVVSPPPGLLLTGGLCLVTGHIAFLLVGEDLAPAIFWPPAGIALGAALIWGLGVIPAALLGTTCGALLWDIPWNQALLLGLAAAAQALAGTLLLRRAGFTGRLSHLLDLIRLVLLGGLLAGGLAAVLSYLALRGGDWLWEVSPLRGAGTLLMVHLLAALVFAPILVCRPTAVCPKPLGRPWETAVVLLLLLAATVALAHPTLLGLSSAVFRPYPLMPFLLWLSLRASPFHTALGIGVVYAVAATGSGQGMSHLFMLRPDVGFLPIHGFVLIIGATFMALAVLMVSRALAENALRSSEARLRNVIGLIRNCLWETDAQGRFVFLDSHVESVFALPAGSMLGRRPEEIWPDTLGQAMAGLFRVTLDGKTAQCESHAYRRRDGEMAYLETNCAPLLDANGRHLGWQGITREVSERVRMARDLDESHRRFRQLAENIQEVFWVSERLEKFVYISPKCEEVTGLPPAALYADYTSWQKLV
jgi:PAS domain S-box-containing protein